MEFDVMDLVGCLQLTIDPNAILLTDVLYLSDSSSLNVCHCGMMYGS